MTDVDLQLAHSRARDNHVIRQKADGYRHAIRILSADLPSGEVAREVVEKLIAGLRLHVQSLPE